MLSGGKVQPRDASGFMAATLDYVGMGPWHGAGVAAYRRHHMQLYANVS